MRPRQRSGVVGLLLGAALVLGLGSLLAACNTVAGAGQDVSAVGHAVTNGASQVRQSTGVP
jgi:predicted small secreted protein